jgi:ABC-type amino acid transport system permease subunit
LFVVVLDLFFVGGVCVGCCCGWLVDGNKNGGGVVWLVYIFCLSMTCRMVLPQQSKMAIVSWVRLPFLSGLPAIFQVFFVFFISFPQVGHFVIVASSHKHYSYACV